MKTGTGVSGTPGAGQFFRIDVTVGLDDRIEDASFETVDCLWASIIGAMLRCRVTGMSILEARAFNEGDLEMFVDDIPRTHRAFLSQSIAALRLALDNLQ